MDRVMISNIITITAILVCLVVGYKALQRDIAVKNCMDKYDRFIGNLSCGELYQYQLYHGFGWLINGTILDGNPEVLHRDGGLSRWRLVYIDLHSSEDYGDANEE